MQVIYLISHTGELIEIGNKAPFLLHKIEGLEMPKLAYEHRLTDQDLSLSFHSFSKRQLRIYFHIHALSLSMKELKHALQRMIYPKKEQMQIILKQNDLEYELTGIVSSYDSLFKNEQIESVMLTIICPSPYIFEKKSKECFINGSQIDDGSNMATITNDSDGEIPMTLLITGICKTPCVLNRTTRQKIKFLTKLEENETFLIDTDPKKLEVSLWIHQSNYKQKINAFGLLSPDSSLMQLVVGKNEMMVSAEEKPQQVKTKFIWRNRNIAL